MTDKSKAARVLQHSTAEKSGQVNSSITDKAADNSTGKELTTTRGESDNYVVFPSGDSFHRAEVERAYAKLGAYRSWKEDNPGAYDHAVNLALDKAAHGQQVGGRELVEAIRKAGQDLSDVSGHPVRPNNDFAAPLVRDIAAERPQVKPFIESRSRLWDCIFEAETSSFEGLHSIARNVADEGWE